MEPIYRIGIRSTMRAMKPGDVFEFPRGYNPTTVRSTAVSLKEAHKQAYSISVKPEKIVVTRVS
jgi:hypothetical protein